MKRRILSGLCVLLVCAALLSLTVTAGAEDDPCFIAINDTLLPLESAYMPITVSGQYYLPYTALDSSSTGVSLGFYCFYNTFSNSLMLYTRDLSLTFDLTAGTCVDQTGASRSARAVTRNGRIYVPARFVCEHFGLSYSSRTTEFGPLVRLRTASAKWSDTQFAQQAQNLMAERLRDWRRAQTQTETPSPSPSPTVSPTVTPSAPDTDKSGVHLYLAFQADQTDGLGDLLALLEREQVSALFFFPAQELADYDEAVRSVLCGGHAVGLRLTGATAEENAAQLSHGNALLTQIAHTGTCVVLCEEGTLPEGALRWRTDVDAVPNELTGAQLARAVLKSADTFEEKVYVLSDTTAAGAALMKQLLPSLIQRQYSLRLAVETEL